MKWPRLFERKTPDRLRGLQRHMAVEEAATFRHDLNNYMTSAKGYLFLALRNHPFKNHEKFSILEKLNTRAEHEMYLILAANNAVQIMTPRTHEYIRNTLRPHVQRMQQLFNRMKKIENAIAERKKLGEKEKEASTPINNFLTTNFADLIEHNLIRYMAPYEGDTRFSMNRLIASLQTPDDPHFEVFNPKNEIQFKGNRAGLFQALNEIVLNADQHPVDDPANTHVKLPVKKTLSLEEIEDEQGRWARIRIADNAKGIPPEQLYKIDHEYYKDLPPHVQMGLPASDVYRIFDPGVSHRIGGTGLGLAAANNAIQNHFGRIRVESTPGDASNPERGTTFIIDLPIKKRPAYQVWWNRVKTAINPRKGAA